MGVSWTDRKSKKIIVVKCHLLLFCATTASHFSIELWHVTKSRLCMTTGDDQLSGWTEKKLQSTSQSQTWTQKCPGHCLVVYCPSNPLQLSKSQWHHYNWEVCLANQWDAPKTAMPAASTGQQKEPNSSPQQCLTTCHITSASKVEQIGLRSFASSTIFTWPLTNQLPLL